VCCCRENIKGDGADTMVFLKGKTPYWRMLMVAELYDFKLTTLNS